ncbi:Uncharacterized protein GBIM_03441 [Gryllus bimaculatus]|nr:Uncharacterized protein GBIM_03441 [Gryllus bimaculatus]
MELMSHAAEGGIPSFWKESFESNGVIAAPPHVHVHTYAHEHAHGHGHSHLPPAVGGGVAAGLRGLLVVLALSVHELFEGLAVGLQTTAAHVYYLMGAVAAHKLVLAFCVGLELVAARTRTRLAVLYVVVFAAVSPIGIGVGVALSGDGGASDVEHGVANSLLQGLASGTLLYVVFFEVLQRERAAAAGLGLRQLLAVLAGFALMFGLLIAAGHEHDHGHSHEHSEQLKMLGSTTG